MDVDVVRMRLRGERLGSEALRSAAPVRGALSVRYRVGRAPGEKVIVATLVGDPPWPAALPVLDYARMTRLQGDSFILSGIEEVERMRRRVEHYPQAWWCRLVVRDGPAGGG